MGLFGSNPVGVTSVGGFLLHLQHKTAIFVPKKRLPVRFIRQFFDKIKFSSKLYLLFSVVLPGVCDYRLYRSYPRRANAPSTSSPSLLTQTTGNKSGRCALGSSAALRPLYRRRLYAVRQGSRFATRRARYRRVYRKARLISALSDKGLAGSLTGGV